MKPMYSCLKSAKVLHDRKEKEEKSGIYVPVNVLARVNPQILTTLAFATEVFAI